MISPAIDRLLFCGHNRRGTERSKLRIFEIDLETDFFFPVVIAERLGFRPVGVSSCFAHRNLLPRLIEVTLLIGMKPLFLS